MGQLHYTPGWPHSSPGGDHTAVSSLQRYPSGIQKGADQVHLCSQSEELAVGRTAPLT